MSNNFHFEYYLNFVTCKDCGTFVYENGHCFLGKTTSSNGTVITKSDFANATTLYATDLALHQYLYPLQDTPLVTTYCCVTATKLQENFGTVQLDVNSGIRYKNLFCTKKICPCHTYLTIIRLFSFAL